MQSPVVSAAFTSAPGPTEPRGWRPILRLVRLPNLLLMGLCLLLVRACLLQSPQPLFTVSFGLLILASLCVAAAGYIINDYYDVKIDSINRPGLLVVGRVINRRHAMMAHLVLTGIGVLIAGALSPLLGLVYLGSALLLWGYSARFKRLPLVGNVSIATLTGALVLLPELQLRTGHTVVWVYALAAFLLTVVREIIKDVEDMRGDAAHKCLTLPIVWGVVRTKWVAGFFLLNLLVLTGAASVQALFLGQARGLGLWLLLTVWVPLLGLAWRLVRADRRLHFTTLSAWCKWIMLAGVLSMLWGAGGN
ncbi:Geranylgeranylglycerol-phosphate geranylgeranyltransferase [Hymenobacter roseosalivarius DSM 11622]|uniref:Geranylgeranylglycerol-phosphate geranylgeranyltransferase n=1 Tax=Hymenobacter roseosalivarius DSM 11622 TaxID=645990 RepID=A0A1W1V2A0_9BACT|nr:geranylgeranylglycerol-phosphate geranylgeranyltransferase [Hymenobacter roseosalivarius]SMB87479.1 Geranylgeranylglycerol-phosphate geranylgeranyltransferase [Hymenobacter roseosalivarius DSM 11622]